METPGSHGGNVSHEQHDLAENAGHIKDAMGLCSIPVAVRGHKASQSLFIPNHVRVFQHCIPISEAEEADQ